MKTHVYHRLHPRLLRQWRQLHRQSVYSHFFNSPTWFLACLSTFAYSETLIVTCTVDRKLIGILPLVKSKKAGLPTYTSPGNQYLDRSSLLLSENNPLILNFLFHELAKSESFSLAEIPESVKDLISLDAPSISYRVCSQGSFLQLSAEPFPEMDKEHRRRITSKIKKLGSDLRFQVYNYHAVRQLPVLISIENSSRKKALFKDILSAPDLTRLLTTLDQLDPHALLVDVLYYQDQPICYQLGFNHKQTHSGFTTAFHDQFRHLLPGKLSTYLLSRHLFTMGIRIIDMSRGDNSFKKDFAPQYYRQYEIYYSNNQFKLAYWRFVDWSQSLLSKSERLFEITRYSKNYLFRKLLAI